MSIVWTPLPVISYFLPFIGHVGIRTTDGTIYDFGSSFYIAHNNLTFGKPTKEYRLNLKKEEAEEFDAAVMKANETYKDREHRLFVDNCHSHVCMALNECEFEGGGWNMRNLCFWLMVKGKLIGWRGVLKTYGPFFLIVALIAFASSFNLNP